jgi:DNA-binding NtrC family response regulator
VREENAILVIFKEIKEMKKVSNVDISILFVDDEKHFLNSMYINLKSNGISNIDCCQDSRNVISLLKEKKYSIIFLDILMPHIRGDELLSKIVEEYPETRVIMLTALDDAENKKKCLKKGACGYLVKPIQINQLIDSIGNAIKKERL